MKFLNILGVAAGLLMVFAVVAGPAAATTLTSPAGKTVPVGTVFKVGLKPGTKAVMQSGFATVECGSASGEGKLTDAGSSTETPKGEALLGTFGNCNCEVKVLKTGSAIVHTAAASANGNGRLTTIGTEVTVNCFGTDCVYGEGDLGTVNGGAPAEVHITAELKKLSGGFLCASPASFTASLTVTSPTPLFVD